MEEENYYKGEGEEFLFVHVCGVFFGGSGVGSVLLWQCANARVVLAVERVFDMYEKEERVFIKVEV